LFSPHTRVDFTTRAWALSSESSRVGIRLLGKPMETSSEGNLPTEGLHVGSIQVPPSGLPLVFLANSPPTGGYPVIGVVQRSALPQLGQLLPGSAIRFRALNAM
jgi:allophanate hydrolase subunit 2